MGGDFCRQPDFNNSMYKVSKNVCLRKSPGGCMGLRLACSLISLVARAWNVGQRCLYFIIYFSLMLKNKWEHFFA